MATPAHSEDREIIDLEHAYWRAIQECDLDAAMRLTDETCVVTGAQGFAAINREMFAQMLKSEKWQLNKCEILCDPVIHKPSADVAIIAYQVREEMTVDGKPLTLRAADSSMWIRRAESGWRCALHTESLLGDPFGRDRALKDATDEPLAQQDAVANLAVKDLSKAREFYEKKVGLTPVLQDGDEVVVYKSGSSTLNVYRSDYAGTNKATAVTWSVSNIEDAIARLKQKGVTFEHYQMPNMRLEGDVHVSNEMKVAWFKDPDGNILNLISTHP
jgi:catechol 2,3-dioxygenase-like lactoylglutathione lyase family enzyme/ketosteroid isomerase-like protein